MDDNTSRRISEAELAVLEALWDAGESLPAKTIQETLKERRGWERTTVRSLITRLADKGTLDTDKSTDVALYTPTFTREDYAWDLTEVLLDRLYMSQAPAMVKVLLERGALTAADLRAL